MPLRIFFKCKDKSSYATKPPRGGGAKGLSGRATKKKTFFAASLIVLFLVYEFFIAVPFISDVQKEPRKGALLYICKMLSDLLIIGKPIFILFYKL